MARPTKNYEVLLASVSREAGEGYRGATRTQLLLGVADAQIRAEAVRQKELRNLITLSQLPEYSDHAQDIKARILELTGITAPTESK